MSLNIDQNTDTRIVTRNPIFNQIATMSILFAFAMLILIPFSGAEYWGHNVRIQTIIQDLNSGFKDDDVDVMIYLMILLWKSIIVVCIGLSMLPLLAGIINYYRNKDSNFRAITFLILSEGLALASSVFIKMELLRIVNQPFNSFL